MVGDAAHDGTPKSSQAHFRGTHTTSQISAHEQIRYLMQKQTVEGERNKASLRWKDPLAGGSVLGGGICDGISSELANL